MKKLIAATTIALSSLSAHAEFVDGNKLLQWFESSDISDNSLAYGYVAGVFDALSGSVVCAPENVTIKQVADMSIKGLNAVPEARNKSADQFVSTVLTTKWPCKKKKTSGNNV